MKDIRQSIVDSLDGRDIELYPFMPEILQDLWEIGADPGVIIDLIGKHADVTNPGFSVLDLGCGKGAVSIHIAKHFQIPVHGIDAMDSFIKDAGFFAQQHGVQDLCSFEVGDIRSRVNELFGYDAVILGSIGPVLGNVEETLTCLKSCLTSEGIVLLDDGYLPDTSNLILKNYLKRREVLSQIERAGWCILEEKILDPDWIEDSDIFIYDKIQTRIQSLIQRHPEKRSVFEDYLRAQRVENEVLEKFAVCVTWVLKPKTKNLGSE